MSLVAAPVTAQGSDKPLFMDGIFGNYRLQEMEQREGLILWLHYKKGGIAMRKNFGPKPCVYPEPVLIIATYGEDGIPDAMNAAWGGISEEAEISICLSPEHKTVENILFRKAFTVSMATVSQVVACDYVGIVSGNNVPDKFARAGFHAIKSDFVDAPLIAELPMALECKLISYDSESCRLVGEIMNVCAEEEILTNGKIDPAKLQPIIYDGMNHDYYAFGKKVGKAFHDGVKLK